MVPQAPVALVHEVAILATALVVIVILKTKWPSIGGLHLEFLHALGGAASSFGAFSRALGATLPRLRCSASRAPTPSTSRARQAGGKWHHEVQVHGLRVADGPSHRSFQGGLVPPPDQLIGSLPYLLLVTEHQLPPWVVMWPWQVQAMHVLSEHMVAQMAVALHQASLEPDPVLMLRSGHFPG